MTSYRKTMREAREEMLVISEAKYELYHKDFSTAMQHAYKMAKKLHGITVDPKEIDDKVASGPKKPSEGKTNSYRLEGDKGAIQVQVYNKGGSKPFELNFYKEEFELDEGKMSQLHQHIKDGKSAKEIAKIMKLDVKTIQSLMDEKIVESVESVESELDESVIDKVKEIASKKSAAKIDGVMVDSFTASAISQIYDKVNDASKKKMDGLPITKLATLAMKMMQKNEYVPEDVDLDEASKLPPHLAKFFDKDGNLKKDAAARIAKGQQKLNIKDVTPKGYGPSEEADLDEAEIDPADIDTSATDDDIKSADKNILMQLRKSVSLRGQHPVEFLDKKKIKIPQKIAQAALTKYSSLKKPVDKEKFQSKIAKSHRDLLMALKESNEKMDTFDEVKNFMRKFKENNNG